MLRTTLAIGICVALSGCAGGAMTSTQNDNSAVQTQAVTANPLMTASTLQYQTPDFTKIEFAHFRPAIMAGIAEQKQQITAIANNRAAPSFDNTIVAMEKSGALLKRASGVFYNLAGTDSNEQMRALQTELAPMLSSHRDDIYLNAQLFSKVKTLVNQQASLNLDGESARLLQITYERFISAGAALDDEGKAKVRELNKDLASLQNEFGQKQLAILSEQFVYFDNKAALAGLSDGALSNAAALAAKQGKEGQYALKLSNTTRQSVLASLDNRDSREKVFKASFNRANQGDNDTRQIVAKLAKKRAQKAHVLGFENWAEYRLQNTLAQTPDAVIDMFSAMVPNVVANTEKEAAAIKQMIERQGGDFDVKPWDWAYYAEKVRQDKYAIDSAQLQQYFQFDNVLEKGVFYTMNQLFGITFKPRPDLPVYHPDVKAYEIFDDNGDSLAIFFADYFAREGKRGGAWMSSFVGQSRLLEQKPVVVNVMNIPKAAQGQPQLVSFDNVSTMFHEMGHGLHGALSNVNYPSLAGTAVSRDMVEFPSTFQEDWSIDPQVLSNYAKHHQTGEAIPKPLLDKAIAAAQFNQGFDTLEYMAASLLDQQWHSISHELPLQDVEAFEAQALANTGVDIDLVPPRYRSTFFSHTFAGGYSASYYAYMWSEIMAADAFEYVQQNGGLNRENGDKFRRTILEVGNSVDGMEAYQNFKGSAPTTEALLKRRGIN
ncbi:M3 family metallopeptidase [Shewanella waksmanii]|uniref:M3 family metallopeptidase n=1 Tax=Shewanella waksmanii TaxID=213783 RepID=UPI00048B5EC1|nr:M3 family metallopeptidase [Shewanella waksmanii]